ncbi:MAG: hypothetical protein AB7K37_12445 [Cyclobacteriaceae bacterium]
MKGPAIKVRFISGIEGADFEELSDLGYLTDIPDSQEPQIMAFGEKLDDYLVMFTIYFTLKVADEIASRSAKKLLSGFVKTIKKIWERHKNHKPSRIETNKEPVYKKPKGIISMQISEDEFSTFELSNKFTGKQLDSALKTFLDLVALQYKNRLKERKLKKRLKK